jgi:hypothetical protein
MTGLGVLNSFWRPLSWRSFGLESMMLIQNPANSAVNHFLPIVALDAAKLSHYLRPQLLALLNDEC